MTYVDFLERVRKFNSYYVEVLEAVCRGKTTAEKAGPALKRYAQDVARALKAFEANREPDSRDVHLCPVCNRLVHTEGSEEEAEFPARVGQRMEFQKDIWQSHEGYECPRCRYSDTHKIEHWE